MISIIHPSRGRPQKAFATALKWIEACSSYPEYICSIDKDDPYIKEYVSVFSKDGRENPLYRNEGVLYHNDNRSAVDAINNAAKIAKGDILIVISDDIECFPGWDDYLMIAIGDKKDFILKTQDGIQKWICTLPILDRAYYNRFGYIYYPEYQHMFCDTELTMVADLTGRKITSDLLFPHKQYSVTGEKPDEVNKRADLTWNQGEKLFLERIKINFGLKPEEIKEKVTDKSYINWARSKGVRI